MTERDLDAVIAYLRTIKPIKNTVRIRSTRFRRVSRRRRQALHRSDDERQAQEGLLSRHHRALHGMPHADGPRGREFATKLGAGGFEFPGPWGVSVSRNITSSKEKGIGAWTDEEIKRAITQGISKDGSKLKPPMGFDYYATMTPPDLDAVVAYPAHAAGEGLEPFMPAGRPGPSFGPVRAYISRPIDGSCRLYAGHPRRCFVRRGWPG